MKSNLFFLLTFFLVSTSLTGGPIRQLFDQQGNFRYPSPEEREKARIKQIEKFKNRNEQNKAKSASNFKDVQKLNALHQERANEIFVRAAHIFSKRQNLKENGLPTSESLEILRKEMKLINKEFRPYHLEILKGRSSK